MIIVVERPGQTVQLIIPADETRTDDDYYRNVAERHFRARGLPVSAYQLVSRSALPRKTEDRVFRDAWRAVGQDIAVDIDEARTIQMTRIRARRDARLRELDEETLRAVAKGDSEVVRSIEGRKQRLRDLPANTDLSSITDTAALAKTWPAELEA